MSSCEELATIALSLCRRVDPGPQQLFRLVGVGLSNFRDDVEIPSHLFAEEKDLEATAVDEEAPLPSPSVIR
jgi:DNA polymerase-4